MSAADAAEAVVTPPPRPARAVGGILAACISEAGPFASDPDRTLTTGRISAALLAVGRSYVANDGDGVPVDVATRCQGVPAPTWLLAVAVVRPQSRTLASDAVQLARAAGVPGHALRHCVSYVALAAELLTGRASPDAIEAATGEPAPRRPPTPGQCGEPHLDALSIGIWALSQTRPLEEILLELAPMAPPSVRSAAAALLGVRDGADALPAAWRASLPDAADCQVLADDLLQVRQRSYLRPRHPTRAATPARGNPMVDEGPARGDRRPPTGWSWGGTGN